MNESDFHEIELPDWSPDAAVQTQSTGATSEVTSTGAAPSGPSLATLAAKSLTDLTESFAGATKSAGNAVVTFSRDTLDGWSKRYYSKGTIDNQPTLLSDRDQWVVTFVDGTIDLAESFVGDDLAVPLQLSRATRDALVELGREHNSKTPEIMAAREVTRDHWTRLVEALTTQENHIIPISLAPYGLQTDKMLTEAAASWLRSQGEDLHTVYAGNLTPKGERIQFLKFDLADYRRIDEPTELDRERLLNALEEAVELEDPCVLDPSQARSHLNLTPGQAL